MDSTIQGCYPGRQHSVILTWDERLVASRLAGFLGSHGVLESRGSVLIDGELGLNYAAAYECIETGSSVSLVHDESKLRSLLRLEQSVWRTE